MLSRHVVVVIAYVWYALSRAIFSVCHVTAYIYQVCIHAQVYMATRAFQCMLSYMSRLYDAQVPSDMLGHCARNQVYMIDRC